MKKNKFKHVEYLQKQDFLMNTIVEQKIYSENSEQIYKEAVAKINYLENLMSFFIKTSDVSKINHFAGEKKVKVSPEVMIVLRKALEVSKVTKGKFDITLAPVINLWRQSEKIIQLPSPEEINSLLSCVGYTKLKLSEEDMTAFLEKKGCAVDLGGIAKGYAADECISIYKSMGVKSGFVNFGGNVKTIGCKADGSDWVIGIQHPDKPRGEVLGAVLISNKSVVTSGIYERYFEVDEKKYHHIIDEKTGRPSESDIKSITIICSNSMQADALSTAVLVMGLDKGIDFLSSVGEVEAIIVTRENKIYLTKGIDKYFFLLQKNQALCEIFPI